MYPLYSRILEYFKDRSSLSDNVTFFIALIHAPISVKLTYVLFLHILVSTDTLSEIIFLKPYAEDSINTKGCPSNLDGKRKRSIADK